MLLIFLTNNLLQFSYLVSQVSNSNKITFDFILILWYISLSIFQFSLHIPYYISISIIFLSYSIVHIHILTNIINVQSSKYLIFLLSIFPYFCFQCPILLFRLFQLCQDFCIDFCHFIDFFLQILVLLLKVLDLLNYLSYFCNVL